MLQSTPLPIAPSPLPTGRTDLMYCVVNWLPASPTCPAILRQSDLSPGWILVLWGWMSDELYRFPAQLLISQQWSYLSGYANLLLRQVSSSCSSEQWGRASCGKWGTAFLQIPHRAQPPLWISWQYFSSSFSSSSSASFTSFSVEPHQTLYYSRSQKMFQMGKQKAVWFCVQHVTISHTLWSVFQRNAVMSSFKERLWPQIKL